MVKGFNPSNAGRWMHCGGSVGLSQPILSQPSEMSDGALEGIAAHWVVEQVYVGNTPSLGSTAPNGVIVSREMVAAAKEYVALLPAGTVLEKKVDLDIVAPGMTGYIDAYRYERADRVLDVFDYKYGHTFVDEFENWQMLVEIANLVDAGVETIRMHIFQPRCYQAENHRVWEITRAEYVSNYRPRIQKQALTITQGDAIQCWTGKHCGYCPAAGSCNALARVGYETIDMTLAASSTELTPLELANELRALHTAQDRLKARLTGLEENASAAIRGGAMIPGYSLAPKVGNRVWSTSQESVIALAKMSKIDIQKPTEAITPLQAITAGMSEAAVMSLSTCPPRAAKLTKVNPNLAKKVFK